MPFELWREAPFEEGGSFEGPGSPKAGGNTFPLQRNEGCKGANLRNERKLKIRFF